MSVGKVVLKKKSWNEPFEVESGGVLEEVQVAYEQYGELNKDKTNAILLLHPLSGHSHAAGRYQLTDKYLGWWDHMIGSACPLDTDRFAVFCPNTLAGCSGTTGPSSIHPRTGKPYCLDFPVVTINDMVRLQKKLIDSFGIPYLRGVIGGSMGGFQALEWMTYYADFVRSAVVIASAPYLSSQAIAFNDVGRYAILTDPRWCQGQYYGQTESLKGLAVARMLAHITYLSEDGFNDKFGRKLQEKESFSFNFDVDFQVESYLRYQGQRFVERFDANSYLYITKALDYFDLSSGALTLTDKLKCVQARSLIISYSSDWLFPTSQSQEILYALLENKKDVSFCELHSNKGHDAFLMSQESASLKKVLTGFYRKSDE